MSRLPQQLTHQARCVITVPVQLLTRFSRLNEVVGFSLLIEDSRPRVLKRCKIYAAMFVSDHQEVNVRHHLCRQFPSEHEIKIVSPEVVYVFSSGNIKEFDIIL